MANDIRGWTGSKFSRHLSDSWAKIPEKPQPRKLIQPGIEPWAARWETTMLPLHYSGGLIYSYFHTGARCKDEHGHWIVALFCNWVWTRLLPIVLDLDISFFLQQEACLLSKWYEQQHSCGAKGYLCLPPIPCWLLPILSRAFSPLRDT